MNRKFTSTDPSSHQGNNIWFTPKEIITSLGPFDLDVCTISLRPFDTAKEHIEYDKDQSAFNYDWKGFIWMNPPYGKEIYPFIEKFSNIKEGIALVFARMGASWMQEFLNNGNEVFLLRKRIKFISKDFVSKTNAGTDSCFLIRGKLAKWKIENSGIEGVFIKGKER
jgi:hypothetical protein